MSINVTNGENIKCLNYLSFGRSINPYTVLPLLYKIIYKTTSINTSNMSTKKYPPIGCCSTNKIRRNAAILFCVDNIVGRWGQNLAGVARTSRQWRLRLNLWTYDVASRSDRPIDINRYKPKSERIQFKLFFVF